MTSPAAESTRTVGPYRLIGQIGEGGMGLVFLAQAPDDRRVAVKILRPSIVGDANGRARLAREVTSLRRVRSPRIAEIYDADPWGETPYVVMRYVPGPSLREVIDQWGPLSGQALGRFARGLAQALVVVHRADVLHRDVKPSNVLIQEGEPVLIDFGLAQLSDDLALTQTGWLLGTPGYLAPEILYGDTPTPAADVHAWAATVTFAAVGHGPYGSGPAMAIMDRARRGDSNLDGVPSGLADVLAAALRPDPVNRPTARQLVEWLDSRMERPVAIVKPPGSTEPSPPAAAETARAPGERWPLPGSPAIASPTAVVTTFPRAMGAAEPAARFSAASPDVVASPDSGRYRRAAFWVAVLLLVTGGMLAAPVLAWCWILGVGWGLQTLWVGAHTLRGWRDARGARRHDELLGALLIPWFALRACLVSLVSAGAVAFSAGAFVLLARFGPEVVETPALAAAGLIAGIVAWRGPWTTDVRRGGRLVTDNLPRSGLATAVILVLILGMASGLLAVQQAIGTSYAPFSG